MFQRKQVLYIYLIGTIFLFSTSFLFYYFYSSKNYDLVLTKKEITGIYELKNVFDIMILLKHNRGKSQIDRTYLDKDSYEDLEEKILNLNNKKLVTSYQNFKKVEAKLSKEEAFNKYSYLLRVLEKEMVDIGDNSTLLFEADRQDYFLMTFLVYALSNITDNIGHIRGLGAKVLNDEIINISEIYNLEKYRTYFYENISRMEHLLTKLDKEKSTKLFSELDRAKREFKKLNLHIDKITGSEFDLDPIEYFSIATTVMNEIVSLYDEIKLELITDLNNRKNSYETILIESIILFIIIILMTIILMIYLIKKEKNTFSQNKMTEISDDFISETRENIHKLEDLKELCDISLRILCDKFNAVNGTVYIFNSEDQKLYLGSSYNVSKDDLQYVFDYRGSYAGEVIKAKEIKVIPMEKSLSIGNIDLDVNSVITIPLINTDTEVGVIQLALLKTLNDFEIKLIERVSNTISNYMYKAKQSNDSMKYVELVDKNVLTSSTNLHGVITYASDAFCKLSQYTKEELIGSNHNIIKHPDMEEDVFKDLWKTIKNGKVWRGEIKNQKKDGTFYWVDSTITPDYDLFRNMIGYTAIRSDITLKKEFERNSITDMLTGLFNRRHFEKSFPEQLNISKRNNNFLIFTLMDIDHFKQYNDTYGHQEGDRALQKVSGALKNTLHRTGDMSFRLGGEEFGMLYQVNEKEGALTIANSAKDAIENLQIPHIKNSASEYVTISMGLCIIDRNSEIDMETIYKQADDALYEAKESGRNKIKIFGT